MKTVESDHVGWVTETGALIGDYDYFFLSQAQKELCKPFMPRISPNKEQSVKECDASKAANGSTDNPQNPNKPHTQAQQQD